MIRRAILMALRGLARIFSAICWTVLSSSSRVTNARHDTAELAPSAASMVAAVSTMSLATPGPQIW